MRRYLDINKEKVLWMMLFGLLILSLAGCSTAMYDAPLDGFFDETNPFGWLLIYPIGWLMHFFGSLFGSSFAIGLILTTMVVRIIAWPIYAKGNDASMKMQLATPELDRLKLKYAGRTDEESKKRMGQETMAIYKKHGINVFSCVMPLLQTPLFIAMYSVVRRIVIEGGALTLTDQTFFGLNLTASAMEADFFADQVFGYVLVALCFGSMVLLQFLQSKKPSYSKNIPSKNPNSEATARNLKLMQYGMAGFMAFAAAASNSLAFYWVVGNCFSILQALINRKLAEKKYYKMKEKATIL